MLPDTALRILALCVLLACAETLHGIARTILLAPRIGKERALKVSAATGSLLAWVICGWMVPDLGLHTLQHQAQLGLGLAAFMALLDVAMGRWLMRRPWHKIAQDFNPASGNYLVWGLAFLAIAPALVMWLQKP